MKLNMENISTMSNKQLLKLVAPSVVTIFNNYTYLNLNDDQKIRLLEKSIEKSRENYDGKMPYMNYLCRVIVYYLEKHVKKNLEDSKGVINFLNDYLLSLPKVNDKVSAQVNINKFDTFITKHNYKLSKESVVCLLAKSESFTTLVKYLIKDKSLENKSPLIELIIKTWYEKLNKSQDDNFDDIKETSAYQEYIHDIIRIPLLSDEEEKKLLDEYINGSIVARDKIVEANLRLVVSIAYKYKNYGIPIEDLIQEGNMGLVHALELYRMDKNCKFTTYAYQWVIQYIRKAIKNKSKMIRVPIHLYDRMLKFRKEKQQFEQELGREATLEELAHHLKMSIDSVRNLYFAQFEPSSINEKIGDGEDEKEAMIAIDAMGPEDIAIENDMKNNIQELFINCKLTEKEKDIIMARYGFGNGKICTLDELGKKYGITRERVRQIELRVLNKLRSSAVSREYNSYISDSDQLKKIR